MSISKKKRELVYLKYDKHCSYCGKELKTIKDMQVDHLSPLRMERWMEGTDSDRIENLMPSCKRCNHYKRAYSLDRFRELIFTINNRIKQNYIVKVAENYGLIDFKDWDNLFYFEKI